MSGLFPVPPREPTPGEREAFRRELERRVRAAHPRLREAVAADVRIFARFREESPRLDTPLHRLAAVLALCWRTDAFLGLLLYRVRTRLRVRGVPVLPGLLHRACMMLCQMCIGDPVVIRPGVYVPHGQVVIDGLVEIGSGTVLTPWLSIGLRDGHIQGPSLGEDVFVGTGARILGPLRIGDRACIAAGAVVVRDVPADAVAQGVPARIRVPGAAPAAEVPSPAPAPAPREASGS